MTLLGLTDAHEVAVIEVGTNYPGEVARLGEVCSPDRTVLTLIGLEHTEGLGDLDGVEREEGCILAALGGSGCAIGNGDDARVNAQLVHHLPAHRRFTYGCRPGLDYRATHRVSDTLDRTCVTIERSERIGRGTLALETRLLGLPGAMAVTAALAVADSLGIEIDAERTNAALLRSDLGETGRLKVHALVDGTIVLDDTYNANPPSMLSSIALANELAVRRSTRLILVLGEMLELGQLSAREHALLGTQLGRVTQLIAVGEQAEPLHRSAQASSKSSHHVPDAQAAATHLLQVLQPGDVVLVKGSRGVHLETVVGTVMAQKGFAA
jgi:UDP-N-acetylmuramoyl-tripeptide--D-alanyl-D-alanine ligase